jgi:hypothetical protein
MILDRQTIKYGNNWLPRWCPSRAIHPWQSDFVSVWCGQCLTARPEKHHAVRHYQGGRGITEQPSHPRRRHLDQKAVVRDILNQGRAEDAPANLANKASQIFSRPPVLFRGGIAPRLHLEAYGLVSSFKTTFPILADVLTDTVLNAPEATVPQVLEYILPLGESTLQLDVHVFLVAIPEADDFGECLLVATQEVNAPIQALLPIALIVKIIVWFNASFIGFKQPLQSRRSLHSPDELLNGANCLEDDDQLWIIRWRSGL